MKIKMRPWAFVVITVGIFLMAGADAATPLWHGMPEQLPGDILSSSFLPIQEFSSIDPSLAKPFIPPPLGDGFVINGVPIATTNRDQLHQYFSESVFINVPAGSQIKVSDDSQGRPVWTYPVGTQVAHLIQLKTSPPIPFELRIVQLLPAGWGFGVYVPTTTESNSTYQLQEYTDLKPENFNFTASDGSSVNVQMKRIRLNSCQACHAVQSPSAYQYNVMNPDGSKNVMASLKNTGPCGFVPANPEIKGWLETYLKKYPNESPFSGN